MTRNGDAESEIEATPVQDSVVEVATRPLVEALIRAFPFPDPREADPRGLLAYGGDLSPERVLSAYAQGIFPWYNEDPILWFSPDPRMMLRPGRVHVSRSLAKRLRTGDFEVTLDRAFREVIEACRDVPRPGQDGTWITDDMVEAYCRLHELGFAHSIETWSVGATVEAEAADAGNAGAGRTLVGGLYGLSLGRAFFGESMFARASDASKIAFVTLVRQLEAWSFEFLDCQVFTDHLSRLGAEEFPRTEFLEALGEALEFDTRRGTWAFEADGSGPARRDQKSRGS